MTWLLMSAAHPRTRYYSASDTVSRGYSKSLIDSDICAFQRMSVWIDIPLVMCKHIGMAPRHYPNKCQFIANRTYKNKPKWNLNKNSYKIFSFKKRLLRCWLRHFDHEHDNTREPTAATTHTGIAYRGRVGLVARYGALRFIDDTG